MTDNKTVPTVQHVEHFLTALEDEQKRQDSRMLAEVIQQITGLAPQMWGSSIVGFGSYHYRYESGREGDMPLVAFSPRKQNLTLYQMGSLTQADQLFATLGKYTTGKGCLYIKRLSDIDLPTLKRIIEVAYTQAREKMTPSHNNPT